MGKIRTFFFDTYAIIEIIFGNPNYNDYTNDIVIATTRLNLMELHYLLLRLYGEEKADLVYDKLIKFTIEVTDDIIKEANKFRLLYKKRKLSYVDCLGYTLAKIKRVKFFKHG